jgi:hypothetical protein
MQKSLARFTGSCVRALVCAALVAAVFPGSARADREYEASEAGNPLKIVYYVAYPVLGLVDVLIFRPAYFLGQYEPFQTIFGVADSPEDFELPPEPRDRDEAAAAGSAPTAL